MKRLIFIWVLALVLSMGCFGHRALPFHYLQAGGYSTIPLKVIPIWIDKEFGEADKIAIDDAIRQWNYALNGYLRLDPISYNFDMEPEILEVVMSGRGWIFLKINSDNPMVSVVDNPKKGTHVLAWANSIGGNRIYLIRDRLHNDWVTGVTLHEMGHLLGSDHDEVYLMQPIYSWEDYRCVDYQALKRVAEYQHLPLRRLNYCIYGTDINLPL